MQINKIIILGGGSSGWMTAAGLISRFPNKDITLIESANINTIGVGESTLAEINDFLKMLGVKDSDWMPFCKATYKLSIDFTNWDGKGTRFHYPFGFYPRYVEEDSPLKRKDQWFQRKLLCDSPPTEYAEFLWDTIELIDNNRLNYDLRIWDNSIQKGTLIKKVEYPIEIPSLINFSAYIFFGLACLAIALYNLGWVNLGSSPSLWPYFL